MRATVARWILPTAIAVMAAGCAAPQPATPPVDTAAITKEIEAAEAAWIAAITARDSVAFMNYYADDVRMLPANQPRINGKEGAMGAMRDFLAMPGLEMSVGSSDVILSQAGDLAIDVGTYRMKFNGPDGKPIEDVGKFVTVFRKTDAGWKAIVDTYNSDIPVPGM